jgi:hypothetical protein
VKVVSTWRYCKAAYHDHGKIKTGIVSQALLEMHPEAHEPQNMSMNRDGQSRFQTGHEQLRNHTARPVRQPF